MKYTIHGFQQSKLIEHGLKTDDALILRVIKDMYESSSMEFIFRKGKKYMWVNYTYFLSQIPIIGEKRNLKRRIEKYGKELFILRLLKHERNSVKGNFSYILPTDKLYSLEELDLRSESPKGGAHLSPPLGQNRLRVRSESPNKDNTIIDSSIRDNKAKPFSPENYREVKIKAGFNRNAIEHTIKETIKGIKNGTENGPLEYPYIYADRIHSRVNGNYNEKETVVYDVT